MSSKKFSRRVGDRLEYFGWVFARCFCALLTRRSAVVVADFMGWMMWRVLRVRRAIVQDNLQIAFGTTRSASEIDRIALRSMQGMVLTFLEFIRPALVGEMGDGVLMPIAEDDEVRPLVGRALVCASGHIGNWEAMGLYGKHYGVRSAAFVKLMHNPLINREIMKLRKPWGIEYVAATEVGKAAVDAVRDGKWLGFMTDQDATKRGIFVDFFGRQASTFKGAALYSWKFGLPILPMYCVRNCDRVRSLKVIMQPLIYPDPAADKDTEILRLTQAHTKALEAVVEQYPESYFWVHRRWKTKPQSSG